MGLRRHRLVFDNENFEYILEVDFQLDSFKEYINITEEIVDNEIKEKIRRYKKFLKEASDIQIEMEYDFEQFEDHKIKIFTHQLYYNSLFISLYSFFERKMYQLCKLAEEKQLIKINDLSGDGILKYYKYLSKVLDLNLNELNPEWAFITNCNKLRNRLVHFPDNMIEKSENNFKQIKTLKSIRNLTIIEKENFIEFEITDKNLLLEFCSIIDKFLNNIYYEKVKPSW